VFSRSATRVLRASIPGGYTLSSCCTSEAIRV
jgi:hypothetical protein